VKSTKEKQTQEKRAKIERARAELFTAASQSLGKAPGTAVHIGQVYNFEPYVTLFRYNSAESKEFVGLTPADLPKEILGGDHVNWVNVEGLHDVALIQKVASFFGLHALTVEDILNTGLRPGFETFPDYSFFALKMLYGTPDGGLTEEHVTLILKGNVVLTFQETPGDVWGKIRDRIRAQTSLVCTRGADYLLYMLIDSIVDGYYQVIADLGEKIDDIEEELALGPRNVMLQRTFGLRREILILRKHIMPVRDLFNKVQVNGGVFQDHTKLFLKDLSDHIVQVTESLTLSMEMSNVLIDTYHSMQNQRLNNVMKTLTIISTIFLPLNFIAGVYGMNFVHMPEIRWEHGYPMALCAMAFVAASMILFFVRKGWIGEPETPPKL
jgi:magnesium transporter